MADRGRPFPSRRSDIRKRLKAVQPPDDRTYSAEVTVFRRNLPHHRSARRSFSLTRLNNIPRALSFVKHNFRKNRKLLNIFSGILAKKFGFYFSPLLLSFSCHSTRFTMYLLQYRITMQKSPTLLFSFNASFFSVEKIAPGIHAKKSAADTWSAADFFNQLFQFPEFDLACLFIKL